MEHFGLVTKEVNLNIGGFPSFGDSLDGETSSF